MDHVLLEAEPNLRNPVLLFAFTGWNDAGEAASTAIRTMVTQWNATPFGEIDPELFTDFATVRPNVHLVEGRRQIRWPKVRLWSASLPGADAVLLLGPEPALRWRLFCAQVGSLAEHLGVSTAISLGALLADYPHTHPVQVIGTASDPDLIDRFELRRSTYEGPTGIVGVLGDALVAAGVPAASLWATVPGYAAQFPSPKACEALLRTACSMVGTVAPTAAFAGAVAEYEARVSAMVANNDDLASYVSRLESLMADADLADDALDDHHDYGEDSTDAGDGSDHGAEDAEAADVADVDAVSRDLVEEVERYLKESGRDE